MHDPVKRYANYGLAVLSGILLTLAFPKADLGWIAWVALVPLLVALREADWRSAWRIGFGAGLIHGLGLMYWTVYTMHVYGYLPLYQCIPLVILLAAYLALYPALFAVAVVVLGDRPGRLLLVAPAAWTAGEYLRARLLTGFPWELLGYSQYDALWIIQTADIFGVYGVSVLIVLVNVVLSMTLMHFRTMPWGRNAIGRRGVALALSAGIVLVAGAATYGTVRLRQIDTAASAADRMRIAVIQGNIDQAVKWDPDFQMLTAAKYVALSQRAAAQSDLIIWPETATPFYLFRDKLPSEVVLQAIRASGKPFLIGSPYIVPAHNAEGGDYYNSAFLITPEGDIAGRYDKVHLVPFGEYVPLKRLLPFINQMVAMVGDFKTGAAGSTLPWNGRAIGMLICYEAIFPELARAMARNDADLLVNITNDAWFGYTSAAYQHFSMSVLRAVENRRPLARAANTGISGFIDPAGRILMTTPLMEDAAVTAGLALPEISSHYTRWGDWPLMTIIVAILGAAAAWHLRRRRSESPQKRVSG